MNHEKAPYPPSCSGSGLGLAMSEYLAMPYPLVKVISVPNHQGGRKMMRWGGEDEDRGANSLHDHGSEEPQSIKRVAMFFSFFFFHPLDDNEKRCA